MRLNHHQASLVIYGVTPQVISSDGSGSVGSDGTSDGECDVID